MSAPEVTAAVDAIGDAEAMLRRLARRPEVRGVLLASADGRALASELADREPAAAAAVVASTLALGARLGELGGDGAVRELLVRSEAGYVVLHAITDDVVVAVVATAAVNLARLRLELRDETKALTATKTPTATNTPTTQQTQHRRNPC